MGYKRSKTYRLTFEDADLAGLEIVARGASMARVMRAGRLAGKLEGIKGIPTAEQEEQTDELLRLFSGCPPECTRVHDGLSADEHYTSRIVSWNFEDDDDKPIEPSYFNFKDQDMDLTMAVIFAWIDAVVGTPGPLDESSKNGGLPEGVSVPMEALSADLLSLPTP